jgi:hypothetical protein
VYDLAGLRVQKGESAEPYIAYRDLAVLTANDAAHVPVFSRPASFAPDSPTDRAIGSVACQRPQARLGHDRGAIREEDATGYQGEIAGKGLTNGSDRYLASRPAEVLSEGCPCRGEGQDREESDHPDVSSFIFRGPRG